MLKNESREEGLKEGEERFGRLMSLLLERGMTEEAKKAAADEENRQEMYRAYGIF
ncbi:MAG: hypothetical protein HFH29_09160 [Eubacterium sp.]|nr:hypothetical protein [Eubacterium sp.]